MDNIRIKGGQALQGNIQVSGAKNAALPMLCASLLAEGEHHFDNVPDLRDIATTVELLRYLGAETQVGLPRLRLRVGRLQEFEAPYELVKRMRASVLVLGPLVARFGQARVSLPGGCAIGARPIDQHLKGFEALGARVELHHGYVHMHVPAGRLRGADYRFDIPTVTGTENLLMAASLAEGRTVLDNAACEPEVLALADMLKAMGAEIEGAGSPRIVIEGKRSLQAASHRVIADRIEAGTFLVAAAATQGDVCVQGADFAHLEALVQTLRTMGVEIERRGTDLCVRGRAPYKAHEVTTAPYPGFPTDMQAQLMTLMCMAEGRSCITETIFENRFMHVAELQRMGARISVRGRNAFVEGAITFEGAEVMATDLRASASLVIAGLAGQGATEIRRVYHLDRGYEKIEAKLSRLGARIERVPGHA